MSLIYLLNQIRSAPNPIEPSPANPVSVVINVEQNGGDYIAFRIPRVQRLTATSDTFRIYTNDDTVDEADGTITVSIVESGESYTVDPVNDEVVVSVDDNDNATTTEARISVADQVVNAILSLDQFAICW